MHLLPLSLFTSFLAIVSADVKFTSPAAGATIAAGKTISVQWKDSGTDPSLSDFSNYQLFLCAGGNDDTEYIQLTNIVQNGDFKQGNAATGTVQTGIGASAKNAYFLKMISAAPGGTVVNFSDRFSLSGMTGVFPPNVLTGITSISGTGGPKTQNNINKAAAAAVPAANGGDVLAYSLQAGPIKYAPMLRQPGSKITAKNASPLYPTSAFTVARTALPPPVQQTTITQSSGTIIVQENTALPLPGPSGNAMEKFLNRWRD